MTRTPFEILRCHQAASYPVFGIPQCRCGWRTLDFSPIPDWATHACMELLEARTLHTVKEVDALPRRSIVLDADEVCWQRFTRGTWFVMGGLQSYTSLIALPARVLWQPADWEAA